MTRYRFAWAWFIAVTLLALPAAATDTLYQFSGIAKTSAGVAINAATVTVKNAVGTATVSIYSDASATPKTNPITAGSDGAFSFYAKVGTYKLDIYNGVTHFTGSAVIAASTGGGLTSPVGVADGGTGATTCTAYSPLVSGTTATGAFRCSDGPGTSGYVWTSQGAGVTPHWAAAAGGGIGGTLGATADKGVCVSGTGGATAKACDGRADFAGGVSLGHPSSGSFPQLTECNTNELCVGGRRVYGYEFYSGDSSADGSGPTWLFGDGRIHGLSGSDGNFTVGGTGTNGHWVFGSDGANTIQILVASSAPYTCDSTAGGSIWMDSSAGATAVVMCFCNGTNWIQSVTGLTCS